MFEWLIFNTVLPLLPTPVTWGLSKLTTDRKREFLNLLKDGQLCFYCTVIGSVLIKDLVSRPKVPLLAVGGLIVLLIVSSASYFVSALLHDKLEEKALAWVSIGAAVFTTLVVLGVRHLEKLL